jgi:hypothetical protein
MGVVRSSDKAGYGAMELLLIVLKLMVLLLI